MRWCYPDQTGTTVQYILHYEGGVASQDVMVDSQYEAER